MNPQEAPLSTVVPKVSYTSVKIKGGATAVTYLLLVLFLISTGFAVYYYREYSKAIIPPEQANKEEVASLVAEVGKLITLPVGETPTLATVSDPKALSNQAFFANSKVGDKVLIYTNAKKAILYRPSEHKIIEVAPVNLNNTQEQPNTPTSSNTDSSTSDSTVTKPTATTPAPTTKK